jgi:Cu(I)/Ag(I) efflux system membrane fusion protein
MTKHLKQLLSLTIIILVFIGGYYIYGRLSQPSQQKKILYYQSGMHPWIKSDKPGKCPLCGMDLMPVYEGEEENIAAHKEDSQAESENKSVSLTQKQISMLNASTAKVAKLPLFKEIRTVGIVAYDPELVVAQEEFIAALEAADEDLAQMARRKLRLMGLSSGEINGLAGSKKVQSNLLLPENKMWIYADVYEQDIGMVEPGTKAKITAVAYPEKEFFGRVISVEPILEAKTRSAKIRIEVNNQNLQLKPQMYVDVYLSSRPKVALSVPQLAVLDTGRRKLVYVEKEAGIYEQREVVTGALSLALVSNQKLNFFPVIEGLLAGEKVVTQASFLVDSQSQLTGGSSALYGGAKEIDHDRQNH